MTGGRWAASSCTALVVLGDGVSRHGFSDPRWDAERLFAHERVHVIQSDFAFLTWSDPVEAWLAGRTGTGCAIYRHLAILQVHVNLDELAPYRLRVSAQLQPGAGADGIPRPVSADLLDLGAMVLEPRNTAPDGTRWYDERWLDPEDVDLEALHLRAPSEPPDMESWQLRLRSAGAMQLLWSSEGAPPNTFHIPTVWLDWVEVEEIEADLTTYQRWSASSPGGEYRLHLFTVSRAGWTLRWERAGASARLWHRPSVPVGKQFDGWSADGAQIVVFERPRGTWNLYLVNRCPVNRCPVNPDRAGLQRLTARTANDWNAVWASTD